jgi:outer membrane lipoprotein-sorting protein
MRAGISNLRTTWILAPIVLTTLTATPADAPLHPVANPTPVLEDLHHKMSALNSVYFEFTQERYLKLFSEPLKSEGVMLIERPDKIRWETISPFQSILMGNHETVAQFEKEDGQWKKLKLGFPQMLRRVMEQMSLMHQGKMDALTSDFVVSVATGSVAVVTLKPKDESVRSVLSSLEIHMLPDFSTTRQVVMNEPNGDLTRILFREEHRDVKLPPGTFDQNKPVDVSVIKKSVGRAP